MHYEMKEVHVTIDPVMDAEFLKTLRLFGTRTCIRYSMEPIKFIKTVYHINTYTGALPRALKAYPPVPRLDLLPLEALS